MESPRSKQTTKTTKTAELPPRQSITKIPTQPRSTLKSTATTPTKDEGDGLAKLLDQYGCGPIQFAGSGNASYERHLIFDNAIALNAAGPRERFEAFARSV